MSSIPYQNRPSATALEVDTPSGCRSSTRRPSRTPNPLTESGTVCPIATAGMNAITAAFGIEMSSACTAQYTAATTES